MDINQEEFKKRAMAMRPVKTDIKEPADEANVVQPPFLKPSKKRMLTPDQQAKVAIGLHPDDPMPSPETLSPQMMNALANIDPKLQLQVMGVLGCLQQFQEKTQALSSKVQQNMDSAIQRTRNTSLAQRAIIRRAKRGTLGTRDVEMARGIIENQGRRGAIDPRQEGLLELTEQREELMEAFISMRNMVMGHMPAGRGNGHDKAKALTVVEEGLARQAWITSHAVDLAWDGYQASDLRRIEAIVEGQGDVRLNQAAIHTPK